MNNKKTVKNIKTPNKFEDGGYWDKVSSNAGITGIAGGIGSSISGNYTTDNNIGEWMQVAGSAASFIPGPWGAVIGAGLNILGGVAERGFGTQWNQSGLAKAEGNLNSLKGFNSGATSYDALMSDIDNINNMNTTVKASDLGKDGRWSNKTQDKANKLNKETEAAYNTAMRNISNTADNIAADTLANLERNHAAFGGLLPRKKFAYGGQTHGADFTNGLMFIDNGGTHESNPYEGVPISMDQEGSPNLVEEGEVIWNDYVFSNRLKVPKSIQKKYKLGKREMTFANAIDKLSKESEERPNDPISMRGLENILMHMAMEQEFLKAKNNTKREGNKFATGGPHRNNANDPRFLKWLKNNNISADEYYAALNYLWNDKEWWKTNITDKGRKDHHAWDGDPGSAYKIILNYMQENDDWKISAAEAVETTTPEAAPVKKYYTRTPNADGGYDITEIGAPYEGVDPTTGKLWSEANSNLVAVDGGNPTISQEMINGVDTPIHKYYYTNTLSDESEQDGTGEQTQPQIKPSRTWMRYAPIAGHALSLVHNIFNKPDYSNAEAIIKASQNLSANPVKFNPIGDFMTYNPFDTEYHANQLRSVAGATRRNIMNTSGGNRASAMTGILASDNNTMNQMGDLYRKAAEYNLEQRQKVAEFNRETNQFNSEGAFRANQANQAARQAGLEGIIRGYMMKEQTKALKEQAIADNISGIFEGLGDIGYENFGRNMAIEGIKSGTYGNMTAEQQAGYTGQNYEALQRRQARQQRRAERKAGNIQ